MKKQLNFSNLKFKLQIYLQNSLALDEEEAILELDPDGSCEEKDENL